MRAAPFPAMKEIVLMGLCSSMIGCANFDNLTQQDRLEQGYTIVLPGIDGPSIANSNIAQGIADSGLETAIEVHDWTTGVPLLLPLHLYTKRANQRKAKQLAGKIVAYQERYPGRPVHLVAQSGGCGVLLWTLESLPTNRKVTSTVMLSAAVSPTYDVRRALQHTEAGIWNYYSPLDVILLAGTLVGGNIDGRWMPGAGAVGFWSYSPESVGDGPRLHQIPFRPEMLLAGNLGGHWGPAKSPFARDYIAPVLAKSERYQPGLVVSNSDLRSSHQGAPVMNLAGMNSRDPRRASYYRVSSDGSVTQPFVFPSKIDVSAVVSTGIRPDVARYSQKLSGSSIPTDR